MSRNPNTKRWPLWFVILYLIILALSHLSRISRPSEAPLTNGKKSLRVQAIKGEVQTSREVRLAYREFSPVARDSSAIVILLHGSPMGSEAFDELGPHLGKSSRVIVPDLPGFGASSADIPDYSMRAHAGYVLQLMDRLHVTTAHIVGYSQGGGVAVNLAEIAPERVASITMLSAVGVQELELLGDYHLNHAIHGVQLGLLWLVQEAVPHFGWLDRSMLNTRYARNFYDSDQRPLRGYLLRYEGPMLILHGEKDELVPYAVALEHHRVVPQSELKTFPVGHGLAFMQWQLIAPELERFVNQAEADKANTRRSANPERVAAAKLPFDQKMSPMASGIGLVVLMLLIAIATLVSEDLTCIATGLLVARGTMGFIPGALACLVGICLGDMLLFLAGRLFGRSAVAHAPLKWFVSESDIQRSTQWFNRHGQKIILLSRFLPGSRLPTFLTAGLLHTRFWSFSLFFLLASAIWTPMLVGVSTFIGYEAFALLAAYQKYAVVGFVASLIVVRTGSKFIIPLFSHKGRRLLLSSYLRIARWEFWPLWLFYAPIVFYVLYLGIKHRCLTLFTAVNPAIPESGFIGESKSAILQSLSSSNGFVARHILIKSELPMEARLKQVCDFMAANNLSLPIVIKPDKGQRGTGVTILRLKERLEECLANARFDVIVQEYVEGHEFGIFYVRYPEAADGFVYSITHKKLISVTGDGERTLEELILDDDRAVCMAPLHLSKHEAHLATVPRAGEPVRLVEVGTHCRGALFLNGESIKTKELEARIDEISKNFSGFHVGRYDIRTPSIEAIMRGRDFKVVELNGVTSEATHIYDPSNSLLTAYRVLMKQWRMAFEIGAQNRQNGVAPVSVKQLFRLLRH